MAEQFKNCSSWPHCCISELSLISSVPLSTCGCICRATEVAKNSADNETSPPPIKVQDVKTARGLASEITFIGAKLYDLLANENSERVERAKALRFLDQAGAAQGEWILLYCNWTHHLLCFIEGSKEYAYLERSIRELIENTKQQLEDLR